MNNQKFNQLLLKIKDLFQNETFNKYIEGNNENEFTVDQLQEIKSSFYDLQNTLENDNSFGDLYNECMEEQMYIDYSITHVREGKLKEFMKNNNLNKNEIEYLLSNFE